MVEPADVAWQLSSFKTPPWMRCRVRHTAAAETVHVLAPSTTTLALELVGCFARNDGTLQARRRSGRPISFHPCPGPAHVQIHFPARQTSWSCSSSSMLPDSWGQEHQEAMSLASPSTSSSFPFLFRPPHRRCYPPNNAVLRLGNDRTAVGRLRRRDVPCSLQSELIKDNAGTRRLGPFANPRGSRSLVVHHAHASLFHRLSPPLLSWPTTCCAHAPAASTPSDVREFIPSSQGPGRCWFRRAACFFDSSTAPRMAVVHGSGTARADVFYCPATSLAPVSTFSGPEHHPRETDGVRLMQILHRPSPLGPSHAERLSYPRSPPGALSKVLSRLLQRF
ncbi:hypothetical protein IWZ01DRAFT_370688 [Phyllosticta capitalensis]